MAFRNPLQNIESQNPVSGGPAIGQMADSAIEPMESTAEWSAVETKLRQPIASVPQQASAGEDRFAIPKIKVSNAEYKLLYNMLSSKSTKAEMNEQEARMFSAMTFAENMDIPFSYAYDNLNSLTKAWNGIEFKPTVSNATAIHNSFQIGPLSRKQANIAYNMMMSGDITDEERQSMIQQLEALDKEIEPLIDDMPRPWYVEMLKSAGQSMMYSLSGMTEGAKGALAGSSAALASLSLAGISLGGLSTVALGSVALPAAALVAGTGLATSMAFQFADTMKAEAGALYWDLLKQGVDDSTAKTVSMIHGGASGSIELWLDGLLKPVLKALNIPVDDFVSDFMTNMIWKGSYSDMAKAGMEFAAKTVTGAAGEGVEEVLQGISGNLMTAIAATLSDTAVEEADWNVFRDFADDFAGGFLSSIVLGAPFSAYNSYITVRDAQYLKDAAPAYSSRESYGKAMSTLKPKELTDADWNTVLDSAYKKGNEEARSSFERSYASLSDEIEKRRKTALDLSAGEDEEAVSEMADGKVVRNDDGSLSASISRGVRIGNRTSNIYTARSAGKDGTLYGYAAYSIDNRNNTLDITSVKMAEPYSGLRQEMITQLIQSYPEMEIRWDAMSVEDQKARQAIIDANPNGADKGLSYGKIMSADERADLNAVKERLGNYFSDEDAVNSALATIIQIQGAKEGISGIRFLDKYLRFKGADEMTDEELSRLGNSRGAITFANVQDIKATILASSKADPTTFMHEMSHLLRRIGNNGDEFTELFERMKSKESFRQFVATNKLILNKDIDNLFTARDKEGNIVWGRAEDEFFAQLAEAYFKNGETYSGMKGFFRRMADWFKMVYRSIRQSAPMNEEIIRFYDNLFYGTGRDEQLDNEEPSDSGNAVVEDKKPIIYYQGSKDRSVSDLSRNERAQLAMDIDSRQSRSIEQETEAMLFQQIGVTGARALSESASAATMLDNLLIAIDMYKEGRKYTSEQIWKATGWYKGVDGKWRIEVSDDLKDSALLSYGSKEDFMKDHELPYSISLSALLSDSMAKAYPELAERSVIFADGNTDNKFRYDSDIAGYYSYEDRSIHLNLDHIEDIKEVLSHELQHAVQHIEGFAEGGNELISTRIGNIRYELEHDDKERSRQMEAYENISHFAQIILLWREFMEMPYSRKGKSELFLRYGSIIPPKTAEVWNEVIVGMQEKASKHFEDIGTANKLLAHFLGNSEISRFLGDLFHKDPVEISDSDLKKLVAKSQRKINSIRRKYPGLDAKLYAISRLSGKSPYDLYRMLAGEAEARNTARRMRQNLYSSFPLSTMDYDATEQIVTMGNSLTVDSILLDGNIDSAAAGSGADSLTLHQTDILSLRNDLEELAASYDDFDEFKVNAILMFDSDEFPMDDKVLQEAYDNAHAAVDENESPENPTLKAPNRMLLGEDEKDEQFVRLIRESDSELEEFISELRRAAHDPESYPEVSRAIDFEVAPIIRNVIFPASKERAYMRDTMRAQRKAERIFEETMDDEKAQKELRRTGLNEEESKKVVDRSIRGIIASSPAFYRELYAKASENSYWMPLATLPEYVNDYLPENFSSYTIAEKRKVLSEIENDLLKKRILSGEEPYSNGYLEELITSQDDKIASANSEISKLNKEMEDISGKYKTSEIKLGVAWKNLQDTEAELEQAKDKIREISEKIAKKASGDTYNSIPQTLVDAKQNLAKQISQLSKQQESYLRQFLRDDASKKISDAVYKQRYADAKRMNDLRKKHEQKIKDLKALYKEKESLRKVKEYKQKLADAIMREPGKGVSIDYADKILAIQALIDPAERSRMMIPSGKDGNGKTIYKSWSIDQLKEMFRGQVAKDPYVFSLLTPSQLERLSKVSLDEMTVSDLENLAVTVNQLRQEGMQERRAYVEAERSRIRTIQNQLYSTVMGSGKYSGTYMAQSAEEKKDRKRWRGIYSSPIYYATVNMARKAQMLDGDKKGLFYDVLIRMKRDAQAVETRAIRSRQEAVGKVMEEHGITYADMYTSVDVEFPSGTERYTISQLAYVYLSKNNERNRQAIAYGTLVNSVEKDQIRRGVEARIKGDTLEAAEERRRIINDEVRNLGDYRYDVLYDAAKRTIEGNADILAAVKAVEADFNSSGFDRVVDMMKNVYNQRVEREMYYLPNSRIGFIGTEPAEKIKQDILNQIPGTKGSVDKGFTMSRIDISPVNQSEIELDLFSVWQDSVFEQEHALANVEYVRLLNGIFINRSSEALRTAISDAYGNGMMAAIDQHIKEVSNPKMKTEKSAADQLIRTLRGNLYSAYLGYKPSSVILQAITSPAAFSAVLSPYQMLKAYMTSIFRFPSIWKEIQQLSPFMVSRSYHVIVGEMKEELAKANLSRFKRAGLRFHEIGQMGLEFIDRFCVGTGWWALYQKELSSIMEEGSITDAELAKKEAARRADEFVSETQPLSDITELSPMFKNKSEALNTLLAFQSSLNVIWQNVTYDIPAAVKNQEYKKALGMAVGYMVAGALLTIVKDGLKGDDDDKDKPEWWQSILYGSTTQLVAGIPAISSAVDGVVKHVITGEDDSFMLRFNDNYPAVTKLLLGVHKALDGKWSDAVSSVSEGMALILGLPVSMSKETIRTAGYIADGEYGKAAGSIVGRRYD